MKEIIIISFIIIFSIFSTTNSQQLADTKYNPTVKNPVYEPNKGPVIFIDEAHNNFHTLSGRYQAFGKLLKKDGYVLKPYTKQFTKEKLAKVKILVISNALHKRNTEDWSLPTPSAFTKEEIIAANQWVKNGGSLFLIADHMPMPGAAADLAGSFGFKFYNGFALDTTKRGGDKFFRSTGTLKNNKITNGRYKTEKIDSVTSFTGQAFEIPEQAVPVTVLNSNFTMLIPEVAWEFDKKTKIFNCEGFVQLAFMKFGKGRIVVSGEAAMFTSQRAGERSVGMGSDAAPQNEQLLLNIIHWLDGIID
jgi:hypothetical protein